MLQYSPKIVTDSLVMCLDASQNKSYPTTDLPVKNGLVMWMDAADDTTFSYSSGTLVSQWRDKSGLNNHTSQATVLNQPSRSTAQNSRKIVTFDGTNDSLSTSNSLDLSVTHTIFAIASQTTGTSDAGLVSINNSLNNGLTLHNGSTYYSYYGDGSKYATSAITTSTSYIFTKVFKGTSSTTRQVYLNGTSATTTGVIANSDASGVIRLGQQSTYLNGTIAEVIIFNRELTATELKQVHTYLGQKWGISNTDRSIVDLSGLDDNGLFGNGTVANMPLYDYYNKGAFKFFANNKYIKLGISTVVNQFAGDFAVSLWAMATAENANYGNLIGDWYTAGTNTLNEWQIMMNNSSTFLVVYHHTAGTPISARSSGFSANTWINVVLSRVGSTLTLYANNNAIGTVTNSSIFGSTTGNVNIGIDGDSSSERFTGLISNVLIYRKGLSAAEVAQNYEAQKSKFANTIVQQGLVLNLDAGNPYSYAGAGSAWYDVSGNNLIFNSQGATQTPFTTIGGSPCFDFNGSGYWECGTNFNLVDLGGDCTIIMWFYCETMAERRTIFEKAGTSYASYQQEIAVTWETGNDFSYYSRQSPDYDYANTTASTVNAWNMVGIKMSTGKTTAARTGFYSKNGSAWQSYYTSRSNVALVAAGAIRVGHGYAGTVTNGYISNVLCYNRMLTDAEILQNYNATKGRFGL